jgi:peptidoglycan/LPS O-acetylase OafA/YrhL
VTHFRATHNSVVSAFGRAYTSGTMTVVKMLGMLLISIVAAVAMAFVLLHFFRKLRRIEEARWGKTPWRGDK